MLLSGLIVTFILENLQITAKPILKDYSAPMNNIKSYEDRYIKMITEVRDYAMLMLDTDGNVLTWNAGAAQIKQYESTEILGRNFRIFYTNEDRVSKLPEHLLEQATLNQRVSHEGWRVKKDGSKFWGFVVISAMHDEAGNVIGFAKVTRDLTENRAAEEKQLRYARELEQKNEELRRSEERYNRMIAEVEDYAIILLDAEGNIQNWNRGAQKIKGYAQGEVIGKSFRIFYLETDKNDRLPERLLDEARTENIARHEGWRIRKDGSQFWGSIVITALHNDQQQVIGFSKVTRDLTQKKRFEDQILQQNKQLEEFAFIASHDLQEPLRKIQIYSSKLLHQPGNEKENRHVIERINVAAGRMSKLIKDILQYSLLKSNESLFEKTDLNATIREVLMDLDVLIDERDAVITFTEMPVIEAIPIQMHQLFYNLVSNSIKFNQCAPKIVIQCEKVAVDSSVSGTLITVTDNGTGFDMKYAEQLFKMFQRGDSNSKGTGIGLALCKKIVENHGGTISAQSTPGIGTTLKIVLPEKDLK